MNYPLYPATTKCASCARKQRRYGFRFYVICYECGHRYYRPTLMLDRIKWHRKSGSQPWYYALKRPKNIYFCQCCVHDF